jgi:threonine/homoserine/homoserine lactone efflux protein
MDLLVLSTFVVAVLLLSVAPGPDMLFIVANGTAGGRAAGLVRRSACRRACCCTRWPPRRG